MTSYRGCKVIPTKIQKPKEGKCIEEIIMVMRCHYEDNLTGRVNNLISDDNDTTFESIYFIYIKIVTCIINEIRFYHCVN